MERCNHTQATSHIEAVVFDLDGTLLDTETLSTQALQRCVGRFGKTFSWETKRKILGLRGLEWASIVIQDLQLEGLLSPQEMVSEWEQGLNALVEHVQAMPGALELVQALRRLRIPMAIATSSNSEAAYHKLSRHPEIATAMRVIVSGNDTEVLEGKPAPDIYLVAARRLGLSPDRCLAFEDALPGVQSASSAGMQVVAVPDPRLDTEPFAKLATQVLLSLEHFDVLDWNLAVQS